VDPIGQPGGAPTRSAVGTALVETPVAMIAYAILTH
jgi:hypothetical protein